MQTDRYHGKFLRFSGKMSPDELRSFYAELPRRSDFVTDALLNKQVETAIKAAAPVEFMPNDVVELNLKEGGKMNYALLLIGVLRNGAKAAVLLDDIEVSLDLRCPDGLQPVLFEEQVMRWLRNSLKPYQQPIAREMHNFLPFKYYRENPVPYLRLIFSTSFARRAALNLILDEDFSFSQGMETRRVRLETANDDKSNYHRVVARRYGVRLCAWGRISQYRLQNDGSLCKQSMVPHVFRMPVTAYAEVPQAEIQAAPELLKDRSMVLGWDIETFSNNNTGNAPLPENVFDEHGREADTVFMDSCSAYWYHERRPLVVVNITCMPCPPRDDCMIVQCDNQISVLRVKALLYERLAPEFEVQFNGHQYDWPFLVQRALAYDKSRGTNLITFLKKHMSCMPLTDQFAWNIRGPVREQKIKIDADTYFDADFFTVPGSISIDVRTVFRQLMPAAEKSSLAFFLAACKLGSKEDMPYQIMFKIYRILRQLARTAGTTDYAGLCAWLDALILQHGEHRHLFRGPGRAAQMDELDIDENPFPQIDDSTYHIDRLTLAEIRALIGEATDVVKYCNVDAMRCQDLLKKRNIIADRRETSNIAFTSCYDAFYRAGGMKVRNLVISWGIKPEWNLAFTNVSRSEKSAKKYPGAYVVPPVKGLFRDHKLVKRRRRPSFIARHNLGKEIRPDEVTPGSPGFLAELLRPDFNDAYPMPTTHGTTPSGLGTRLIQGSSERDNNDDNDRHDRPCAGLDFSSLYPSIIMTYNFSPEKVVVAENYLHDLLQKIDPRTGEPYRSVEVDFRYGLPDEQESNKERIHGWFVQHKPVDVVDPTTGKKAVKYQGMGLYPTILKWLFDKRAEVKKLVERYNKPKEWLSKVLENWKKEMPDAEYKALLADQSGATRERVFAAAAADLEARRRVYEQTPKPFYQYKIYDMEEIIHFLKVEWRAVDPNLVPGPGSGQLVWMSLDELVDEIDFYFNYYNSKQNALKVFMNTFYGEAGNSQSPFFVPHVAGGTTTYGQKNIKFVKGNVERRGYRVLYGDTDSLYICIPEDCFTELDALYETGQITKAEYWTRMIEISMETLDRFKDEVGDMLAADNGTRFLKMAYEEVLWPFAMVGKKKYVGIQHQGIVDLSACLPTCTLSDFTKHRSLFIRGLEIKKRGSSAILKQVCFEILKEVFCVGEVRTLREVVEQKLREIPQRSWAPDIFIKSASYKLPGKNPETGRDKQGNVTVLGFARRIAKVEADAPTLGIRALDLGERFNYVYVKRYPWTYDLRGRKKTLPVAAKIERFADFSNQAYQDYLGERFEVDIDHYVLNEIIGQFARFVVYHPDYDHFYAEADGEDDARNDEIYKAADKRAHLFAKKQLQEYYKANFAQQYEGFGKAYQKVYRQASKVLSQQMAEQCGPAHKLFAVTEKLTTGTAVDEDDVDFRDPAFRHKLKTLLMETAKESGQKLSANLLTQVRDKLRLKPEVLHRVYLGKDRRGITYVDRRRRLAKDQLSRAETRLDSTLTAFQELCAVNTMALERVVRQIKRRCGLTGVAHGEIRDVDEELVASVMADDSPELMTDEQLEVLDEVYEAYLELVSAHRCLAELDEIPKTILYLKSRQLGAMPIPPTLNMRDEAASFSAWLQTANTGADLSVFN